MVDQKTYAGTIDLTPTWEEVLPAWLAVMESGNAEAMEIGRAELKRMAKLADLYVAQQKEGKPE